MCGGRHVYSRGDPMCVRRRGVLVERLGSFANYGGVGGVAVGLGEIRWFRGSGGSVICIIFP